MDIFHEQIIKIKQTTGVLITKIAIWLMAVIIAGLSFLFGVRITPLLFFVGAGALFFAYKSVCKFNIEFEYSFTNGEFDIDKIINKSSRKRVVSFNSRNIEKIIKYNTNKTKNKCFVCTDNLQDAYIFYVNAENIGMCEVVISPNEDIINCFKTFAKRNIENELF